MLPFFSRIFFPSSSPATTAEIGHNVANPRIHILFLLSVALAVAIFVLDMTTQFQSLVCTVPYVFLVLTCLWLPDLYFSVAIGLVTVLVILGGINSSHHSQWPELVFNRSFCLLGI